MKGWMLLGDQLVERRADLRVGPRVDNRPVVPEQDESQLAGTRLLVALQRRPGTLGVDAHRLRREHLVDDSRVPAGEAQRRQQPEADRPAVPYAFVAGGGLERVRERVAEVENGALVPVERIAHAHRRLEGGAAPNALARLELPERLASEQPGLDHLGHALDA